MRVLHGHQHCFFQQLLGSREPYDVAKPHIRIRVDYLSLEGFGEGFEVGVVAVVWEWLDHSVFEVLFGRFRFLGVVALRFLFVAHFLPFLAGEASLPVAALRFRWRARLCRIARLAWRL